MVREFRLICKTCGGQFISKASNIKYCSDKCFPKVFCEVCGIAFIPKRKSNGHIFCSRPCSTKYQMSNLTPEQKEKLKEIGIKNIEKANIYWNTKEGKQRKSEICSKTNSTPERAALVTKQWQNKEFKKKMIDGVIKRWENGVYGNLAIENLKKINNRHYEFCLKCKKETKHNGFNKCLICFPNSGGFNREEFYKEKISLIKLNIMDCFYVKDIEKFIKIPGVWSLWDTNENTCLQVGQNKNIGDELFRQTRLIEKYQIENWNNDHKNSEYFHKLGEIKLKGDLQFKIVKENVENYKERLLIEAQYAHENKAKYWSPEPGQKLYKEDF